MARRYPAGGNYRGQYNLQQPTMSQYESFFNPVPIDFLQEQLRGRQQDYDVSYAGALAAQDQLAQQEVGMRDIAAKNELIQTGMGNIDKIVEQKYGGDWSRASKEVARNVTQLRSNPFWNAQKQMEEKRDSYQAQVDKYGANAMQFGADPRQLSTLDDQGNVRSADELTGEVVEKGDYLKTARELVAGLTADSNPWGLSQEDIDGFLGYGQITEIGLKKIQDMADDPVMQQALLDQHSELRRSGELSEAQQRQHGLFEKTPEDFARQQIFAAGRSSIHKQTTKKVINDPIAIKNATTKQNRIPEYIASSVTTKIQGSQDAVDAHTKMTSGKGRGSIGRSMEYQASFRNLTKAFEAGEISAAELNAGRKELIDNHEMLTSKDADRDVNKEAYWTSLKDQYDELNGVNPDTGKPYTRQEGFDLLGQYLQNQSQKDISQYNLNLADSAEEVNTRTVNAMNSRNWTTESVVDNVTGDVYDKNNLPEKLGYASWQEMSAQIAESKTKVIPKVDYVNNKMTVQLPASLGKKGKDKQPIDVSFDLDNEGQSIIEPLSVITNQFYSPETNIPLTEISGQMGDPNVQMLRDWNGTLTPLDPEKMTRAQERHHAVPFGYQGIVVTGNGSLRGNNKSIYIVNYDPQGNAVSTSQISLENAHKMGTETMDLRYQNIGGLSGNQGKINK